MKKKIFVVILIILIIIPLSLILYPIIKNNNYEKRLLNDIYKNTSIKEITYLNRDNNYYVVKTKDKVLVFDLNYEEVFSSPLDKLKNSDLELVYRRNKLYYEEKVKEKDKLIYKFYDVMTNELAFETSLGGV